MITRQLLLRSEFIIDNRQVPEIVCCRIRVTEGRRTTGRGNRRGFLQEFQEQDNGDKRMIGREKIRRERVRERPLFLLLLTA